MSLLEDVFLEDEAGEARELERVIEGDEYDERPLSPNSDDNEEKGDEAEEDKRRVDPSEGKTKRIIKNPRFVLNPARLTGPRGIQVIPDHFKDFKFKGKGCEKEDLDMVLKKLEHWAYRLYPKFEFVDCLKKIETLGKKRPVMVHLHKIRSDQLTSEETVTQNDISDGELPPPPPEEDEFDKLLQQQIERTSVTPMAAARTPHSAPSVDRSLLMPKATSSPSINEEQRERMLRNRRLAEERRLAKLSNSSGVVNETTDDDKNIQKYTEIDGIAKLEDDVVVRKHNRSNVIDSSSDDDDEMTISHPTTVEAQKKNAENYTGIDSNVQRFNVNDSSSEGDHEMNINHPITIEAQNKNVEINTGINSNMERYNDNDSSSDDDEMSINQSITVEVHINNENLSKSGANKYVENINKDYVELDIISENAEITSPVANISDDDIVEKELFGNNENKSNINTTEFEEITDNNSDDNAIKNDVITNNEDAKNKISDDSTHNETEIIKDSDLLLRDDKNKPDLNVLKDKTLDKIQSDTNEHTKLNEDNVLVNQENIANVVDDLMDVDFDDDF